jgi:hypothetical protein
MSVEKEGGPRSKPYHGMSWPVRLIVYFCGGLVLMGIVALRGKWDDLWWSLWIPPVTGLLGVLCPQAVDWLFARISDLLHRRR